MLKRHGSFFWSVVVLTVVTAALILGFYLSADYREVDTVEVNRIRTELELGNTPENPQYDYVAFQSDGTVISASLKTPPRTFAERVNDAVREGNAVLDFKDGKIIVYTAAEVRLKSARTASFLTLGAFTAAVFVLFLIEVFYLERRVFRPFRKLEAFSKEIANGNFNLPLSMDRKNNFGSFTEAFDIMRQNLTEAKKETEAALDSKRVLLAELGHDIRTPLASILAVAELNDKKGVKGMDVIVSKARQIDKLFNDIYEVSLEEVGALRVETAAHEAFEVKEIVESSDVSRSVKFLNDPPNVTVVYDKIRLQECADNVLLNARKYAEGTVEVAFSIEGDMFRVSFRDFGKGVDEEELAFVTDKFYRGKTARNKTGEGLGLFIARKLLEKMGGAMRVENVGGFKITFYLPIASALL